MWHLMCKETIVLEDNFKLYFSIAFHTQKMVLQGIWSFYVEI